MRKHIMRRIFSLVPWMVVATAAAQEAPRPATLRFTHLGEVCSYSLRSGDELLVVAGQLDRLGLRYVVTGSELVITQGDVTVKVPTRYWKGKLYAPIRRIVEELGGGSTWQKSADTLDVWSVVREVKFQDGNITVDASLSVIPKVSVLDNPPRVSIDLVGGRLVPTTKTDLPSGVRIAQFNPEVVRIVVPGTSKPSVNQKASRALQVAVELPRAVALPFAAFENYLRPVPLYSIESAEPSVPLAFAKLGIAAGPLRTLSENPASGVYAIKLSAAPTAPPNFRRLSPDLLEIEVAGASAVESEFAPTRFIKSVSTEQLEKGLAIRLQLSRPLGVEFSVIGNELQVMLLKPPVGDGKIAGKIIVVDPGHGGHDPGAKDPAKSVLEKNLTLAIGKKLSAKLAEQGATVIMTRKTDEFISLKERPEIANRNKADLFVSVHINSNKNSNTTSGTIVFFHGKDPIGNVLAECIRTETGKRTTMPSIGSWSDTRIYDTGFAVLRYSKMPCVLIEVGFINHNKDRARMTSEQFQSDFVSGIVEGIKVYLGNGKE